MRCENKTGVEGEDSLVPFRDARDEHSAAGQSASACLKACECEPGNAATSQGDRLCRGDDKLEWFATVRTPGERMWAKKPEAIF